MRVELSPRPGSKTVWPLCPICRRRPRNPKFYMCRGCWFELPKATRNVLNITDEAARGRLVRLYRAVKDGISLNRITPGMLEPDGPKP